MEWNMILKQLIRHELMMVINMTIRFEIAFTLRKLLSLETANARTIILLIESIQVFAVLLNQTDKLAIVFTTTAYITITITITVFKTKVASTLQQHLTTTIKKPRPRTKEELIIVPTTSLTTTLDQSCTITPDDDYKRWQLVI